MNVEIKIALVIAIITTLIIAWPMAIPLIILLSYIIRRDKEMKNKNNQSNKP